MITPALRNSLTSLVHPFYVPGSQLLLNPDIYVTVIAWTPFIAEGAQAVLCQGKVLSLLEAYFDLISSPSPSMKIQIMGWKITENLGFESLLRKVNFFALFLFIFKFSI